MPFSVRADYLLVAFCGMFEMAEVEKIKVVQRHVFLGSGLWCACWLFTIRFADLGYNQQTIGSKSTTNHVMVGHPISAIFSSLTKITGMVSPGS
jgi:hypothetical protein